MINNRGHVINMGMVKKSFMSTINIFLGAMVLTVHYFDFTDNGAVSLATVCLKTLLRSSYEKPNFICMRQHNEIYIKLSPMLNPLHLLHNMHEKYCKSCSCFKRTALARWHKFSLPMKTQQEIHCNLKLHLLDGICILYFHWSFELSW